MKRLEEYVSVFIARILLFFYPLKNLEKMK